MIDFHTHFKNKKIVIIGASSGIGAQLSMDMGKLGADLILVSRNERKLSRIAKEIETAKSFVGDISTITGCNALSKYISNNYNAIDHLVITAGKFYSTNIMSATEEMWDSILNTNLKGVYFTINKLIPLLNSGTGKSIVVISSILAHYGGKNVDIYSCSKGALSILIKSLSIELSEFDIRINAVSPGHVRTPFIEELLIDDDSMNEMKKLYPLGRIGTTQDITPLIIFLLSEYASWITGCDYIIDGGRSAKI